MKIKLRSLISENSIMQFIKAEDLWNKNYSKELLKFKLDQKSYRIISIPICHPVLLAND